MSRMLSTIDRLSPSEASRQAERYTLLSLERRGFCGMLGIITIADAATVRNRYLQRLGHVFGSLPAFAKCKRCGGSQPLYGRRTCEECHRTRNRLKAAKYFASKGSNRFDPLEIHERDGWRCQLCGKRVRRDVPHMHPLAPTIDHIIPISKGGPNTSDNLQCAHRRCNCRKRDKPGGQLRLMG